MSVPQIIVTCVAVALGLAALYGFLRYVLPSLLENFRQGTSQKQLRKVQEDLESKQATHRRLFRANLMPETPSEIQAAKPYWELDLNDQAAHIQHLEEVQEQVQAQRAHTPMQSDVLVQDQRDAQTAVNKAVELFGEKVEHLNGFTGVQFSVDYHSYLSRSSTDSSTREIGIAERQ